jgi:hypothetical protein
MYRMMRERIRREKGKREREKVLNNIEISF